MSRKLPRRLVPVAIFVLVTSLMSLLVGLTFAKVRIQPSNDYTAVFADVSGLATGVDVRIAGVNVGRVSGIDLRDDAAVNVRFDVRKGVQLTRATGVRIKYANLTGDRFVELTRGEPAAAALPPGGTIPLANTRPALDLDQLFSGFQPLVQGLQPAELNQLSKSIIAVANGQATAVETLLANVGSITKTLADKDALIGSVISNLNRVLGTVADRDTDLDRLIVGLDRLVGGLAADRVELGTSLARVDRLAAKTGELVGDLRPGLRDVLTQAQRTADLVLEDVDNVNFELGRIPQAFTLLSRAGAYGSFFNFYICGLRFKLSDEGAAVPVITPYLLGSEPRCQK